MKSRSGSRSRLSVASAVKGMKGVKEVEDEEPIVPPHRLRCSRTDGNKWRCKNWKIQDRSFCQVHFLMQMKNNKLVVKVLSKPKEGWMAVGTERTRALKRRREEAASGGGGGEIGEGSGEKARIFKLKKGRGK
ncbi:hypothetical protein Syun_014069 [Stephania yunnanensis]|uniref:WRC domain-containing protein n=1 Tax=Stephania yunnanensis TaxID=152371 RepID=A0AAP0P976_9MAGN